MATIRHDTRNPSVYRIMHFTPAARHCWCWHIVIPETTISGQQQTITSETVNMPTGITAWGVLPGSPSFPDSESAIRWAGLMQLPNVVTA